VPGFTNKIKVFNTGSDTQAKELKMTKTTTMYEIRSFTGNQYSRSLSAKLRTGQRARKLVKYLKRFGVNAFAAPLKITKVGA